MDCLKIELLQGNTVSLPKVDFSAIAAMFAGIIACAAPLSLSNGAGLSQFGTGNVPTTFKKAPVSKAITAEGENRVWLSNTSKHLRGLAHDIESELVVELINLTNAVRNLVGTEDFEESLRDHSTYESGLATLANIEECTKMIEAVLDSVRLFEKISLAIFPHELGKKDLRAIEVVSNYYEKMNAFKHEFKLLINQAKPVDIDDFKNFDLSEDWDVEIETIAKATVEHFSLSSVA